MKLLKHLNKSIQKRIKTKNIKKEIFRKSIHMLGALCSLFVYFTSTVAVIATLFVIMLIYALSEALRLKGKDIYIISKVVKIANRKRDEKHISLGPITFSIGIIISLYFFPLNIATVAIFALSFGDGIASLIGKIFGKRKLIFEGKTYAGSSACFLVTFLVEITLTKKILLSFIVACFTTIIELFPLKDFDNIAIPLFIALLVQCLNKYTIFTL